MALQLTPLVTPSCRALGYVGGLTLAAWFFAPSNIFSWHPTCMGIGFILVMTEGILRAIEFRFLEKADRVQAIRTHGYIQLLALIFILLGFFSIYLNKERQGKPHVTSTHAKVGAATGAVGLLALMAGAVSFRSFGLLSAFPERMHGRIKASHRMLGAATWTLSLAAIELGLQHPAADKGAMTRVWQLLVGCLAGLVLLRMSQDTGGAHAGSAILEAAA
uniref:Cytochrome b-561-like protein n=1 Tax=Tetraselmis sp. GSL018 TaxID=582737 RepID=A0A061QZV1_9CHLO|mmetsp:Transcript_30257/g.71992  ORF Transcript_30257/g.71992 Transcript_30257/m.71992 type:complete len:219 (+) Transcript_30257:72-728(+)